MSPAAQKRRRSIQQPRSNVVEQVLDKEPDLTRFKRLIHSPKIALRSGGFHSQSGESPGDGARVQNAAFWRCSWR
jgi:hypothetical protein